MTIQPSVIVWTVINFCALMLILNFLLFKPLLKVIDRRNSKISEASRLRDEKQRAFDTQKLLDAQSDSDSLTAAKRSADAVIAKAKTDADKTEAAVRGKCASEIVGERARLDDAQLELDKYLIGGVDDLVRDFADKIVS